MGIRVDGKQIAENILAGLSGKILQEYKNTAPTLAVILIGNNPGSISYIKQKQKAATQIGANVTVSQYPETISEGKLQELIRKFNQDQNVQGVIIQRPLPGETHIDNRILNSVRPEKDVDGFVNGSDYEVPVALAVVEILKKINGFINLPVTKQNFIPWLTARKITIIGKGETAGKPVADYLHKLGCTASVINSQTDNPDKIIKSADLIVSCVGKSRIVKASAVTPGVILISVGIWRDNEGKLHGDYEADEMMSVSSFYTPTPGGVGPVNVACLMSNLVKSYQNNRRSRK